MGSSVVMCVLSILPSVLTDFAVTLYKGCSRAANLGQLAPDKRSASLFAPLFSGRMLLTFFFSR